MAQLRAPSRNGEVLASPDFDAIPALVAENRLQLDRDDVRIGGLPLKDLRALARRGVLNAVGSNSNPKLPLLLAGHQPELAHPGVWAKNFVLNGLARKIGGTPLNLIVDNDTLKSTALRLPVLSGAQKAHLESVQFDTFAGEATYECRPVIDPAQFRSFPERVMSHAANWGYAPLLRKVSRDGRNVGETFTAMRRKCESNWGCRNLELPASRLSQLESFARFAKHILDDLPRFREVYNAAIRAYRKANGIRSENHPAPDLADGEAPFWVRTTACRRERASAASDVRALRPRALTLTLFARVCLGDFFIHGIGGGKYDEVTDTIIRDYFGIEPPAYQVLSATLHLPLPAFSTTDDDVKRAERRVRDLHWNPHVFVPKSAARDLMERHAALCANEPPYFEHAARKTWFRELQQVKELLRASIAGQIPAAEAELEKLRAERDANAILQRRDYSWVLYPEETLRPFLQQFLEP